MAQDASDKTAALFRCTPDQARPAQPAGQARGERRRTIDLHCHALCVDVEKLLGPHPRKLADQAQMNLAQGAASVAHNAGMLADVGPKLANVELRLQDMDRMGVDVQVISPAPNQYYYWAEDELAEQIVLLQNEHIAALCERHPQRLAGLGTVALQHPALAVRQLEHAVRQCGLRGVEISTSVNGVGIADPRYDPLWAKAEELGCMVLLHPLGSEQGTRLDQHYLWNVIGQPLETTIALSQLIFSGMLDRYPRTKLCACHGGGYLAAYAGRSDHAHAVRPEARGCAHPPSSYLRKIYVDTVVHDPAQLRQLIDTVGASQVVVGTDYPFDMGSYDIHAMIDAVPGLSAQERQAILSGNAERLLTLADGLPFGAPAAVPAAAPATAPGAT